MADLTDQDIRERPHITDQRIRRPFDGPVVPDLAAVTTPGIAQSDARWAAAVLAGGARDGAELRGWLETCGLLDAPSPWQTQNRGGAS